MAKPNTELEVPITLGLTIRPGDTLIIGMPHGVSMAVYAEMKAKLLERIPGLADVVLIVGVTHLATYRPAPPEAKAREWADDEVNP